MREDREYVAILDFGSQYSQLIARRVRECNVFSEIVPFNVDPDKLRARKPRAIILSGGPASIYSGRAPVCDQGIFNLGIPVLGICYGMQIMGGVLGGKVEFSKQREYGKAELFVDNPRGLFKGLRKRMTVWMSHGDKITDLPKGFQVIGHTRNSSIAAISNKEKNLYGLQFHPEVIHTPNGKEIIRNFLYEIAGCSGKWNVKSFVRESVREIRNRVGKQRVVCALSGGVDSSVLAILLYKALGKRLLTVFVNNGLLRKDEEKQVIHTFRGHYHLNLRYVDASNLFLDALKGIIDPEQKRKIIGREFIRVFEEEAKKAGKLKFLAQGTLYPDVIESRSAFGGPSAKIKSHHNVGGLPEEMHLELIEPLKNLFKDEVRVLGKALGLSEEIIWRQPFPGPGLAVRIIGEVTRQRLDILKEADAIVVEEIKRKSIHRKLWQFFSVLLPVKTVGVMGDERTYENVIALRVVTSTDGMTADWARLPGSLLERISTRIINEVQGVNRVTYDITSKPPGTIEWE